MENVKRTRAIAILLCGLCGRSFAVIHGLIDAPQDDGKARNGVWNRPGSKPLQAAYSEVIQKCLWPIKLDEAANIFGLKLDTATNWWGYAAGKRSGPTLEKHPADLVLPIFAPGGLLLGGLHTGNPDRDKSHTDLYAVGDIGYVEFYSHLDGKKVQSAVIYFRADKKFVPLTSTNDFSKRLEWDKAKFDALKKWLDHHIATDLGEVEVSEARPSHIDLVGVAGCILRIQVLHAPNATNRSYRIGITKETPDPKGIELSCQSKSIERPGESFEFSMDGKFYRLTPKLVEQRHESDR
jgi:hypothetical protein